MEIGIGLPSTIPGIPGSLVAKWAMAAERAGFSTLGTIDRIVYGNLEPLAVMAAAAAVTERIRLTTSVLIGPYRGNGALLAKQLSTIDELSGRRLRVGLAVGLREDDYEATGTSFRDRGRAFERQLAELCAIWSGESRGYAGAIRPGNAPPLLIGGNADAAFRRMAQFGTGWIFGGGGPEAFAVGASRARQAWRQAGREGEPRLIVNVYACLGVDAEAHARRYLGDYYAFAKEYVDQIVAGALTSPQAVAEAIADYAEAGCDELVLFPCNPDLAQVTLLADAVNTAQRSRSRERPR